MYVFFKELRTTFLQDFCWDAIRPRGLVVSHLLDGVLYIIQARWLPHSFFYRLLTEFFKGLHLRDGVLVSEVLTVLFPSVCNCLIVIQKQELILRVEGCQAAVAVAIYIALVASKKPLVSPESASCWISKAFFVYYNNSMLNFGWLCPFCNLLLRNMQIDLMEQMRQWSVQQLSALVKVTKVTKVTGVKEILVAFGI